MNDTDAIHMMRRCSEEIKALRGVVAHLKPKADAYDSVRAVLRMLPQRGEGEGEDLAWRLDQEIAKMQRQMEAKTELEGREA